MKELDIYKLERFLNRIEFICSIHVIAIDKHVQPPAKFDNVIDSIFKVLLGMNYHKGKKFFLQYTIQHNSNLLEDFNF